MFRLQPYFNNFNKRLTKTPKLYFYDTGIVCSLLKITSQETLTVSPFKGNLFENLIITDLIKQFYNKGDRPSLYFWRDRNGIIEVDAIVDKSRALVPIEIKASETFSPSFFDAMLKWNGLSKTDSKNNIVIYSGDDNQKRSKGSVIGWQSEGKLIDKLFS